VRAYRQPLRTGKRGRPALVVPETLTLTQTVKHRDERILFTLKVRNSAGITQPGIGRKD
jgi:hypothetical protein